MTLLDNSASSVASANEPVYPDVARDTPDQAGLDGRRIYLRPLWSEDLGFLYQLSTGPQLGYRWRYRGQVPSVETFAHDLWNGILCQFLVVDKVSEEPMGHVLAHSADLRSGFAHIAVLMRPEASRRALGVEAGGVFINYLYVTYNLRKLYAESLSYTLHPVQSALGRTFEVEGCLRDHEYYDGRYWDLYMLAHYRATWEQTRDRLRRRKDRSRDE